MNEDTWLSSTEPTPLIRHLVEAGTDDRRMRLLACACCRQAWHLLRDPRSRHAVEIAERYADGEATVKELARARNHAMAAAGGGDRQAAWAAYWAANVKAAGPLWSAFAAASGAMNRQAAGDVVADPAGAWEVSQADGNRDQVALIYDVIGNPFRPTWPRRDWLIWANGVVPAMARAIYTERAFEQMPILGDALEEAGCDDPVWLDHCRAPDARHVRGCWVLDALTSGA